jgi:hypothetical protein
MLAADAATVGRRFVPPVPCHPEKVGCREWGVSDPFD